MSCPFENRLLEYVDDVLGDEAKAEVGRHLASCETCTRQLVRIRRQRVLLAQVKTPDVPTVLWQRLRRRLDVESKRVVMPWSLSTVWKPLVGLAAAAVVVVATIVFLEYTATHNVPAPTEPVAAKDTATEQDVSDDLDAIVREHELVAGLCWADDLLSAGEAQFVLVPGDAP